jgi:pyruvate dehydrogenase E1 component beta subunit
VVFPSFAHEAKSLLRSAINDPNPVIFIEDRWCHSQETLVTSINHGDIEIGKARIVNQGDQLTLVSSGYLTIESLKAVEFVKQYGASVELIDLRSIKPIDYAKIFSSIKKTHKLLVVDSGNPIASIASEIISVCAINCFKDLRESPSMLTPPDVPEPTSYGVTEKFKISALSIAQQIFKDLKINPGGINFEALKNPLHDVPNKAFSGPF